MKIGIGVKAVIVKEGKILFIRRRPDDPHNPGLWDLPGGRINEDESPQEGLIREALEEVGLNISVGVPLDIQHFTRQDGQVINLIFFSCKYLLGEIKLSHEHTEYIWVGLDDKAFDFPPWFPPVLKNYQEMYR